MAQNGKVIETEKDLLTIKIQSLYDAEEQLIEALPLFVQSAGDEKLKASLEDHLEVTKLQRDRLGEIARALDIDPKGLEDNALTQILEEGQALLEKVNDPALRDMVIMGGTSKVEHYEMAAYHSAMTLAKKLNEDDTYELLKDSHHEEEAAAKAIEDMSETGIIDSIKEAVM